METAFYADFLAIACGKPAKIAPESIRREYPPIPATGALFPFQFCPSDDFHWAR
jgi:hypothetical protein